MKIIYIMMFFLVSCKASKSFKEIFDDPRDGQKYNYITINNYHWMTENMRYNMEGSKWNPENPDTLFGRLYNGYQAQKVCPDGWSLTTTYNWFALERMLFLPNDKKLYRKGHFRGNGVTILKSKSYWKLPGTDSLKLNILPAGITSYNMDFGMLGEGAFFWTSTQEFEGVAEFRYIHNDSVGVYYDSHVMEKQYLSCRCVRYIPEYEEAQKKKKQRNK